MKNRKSYRCVTWILLLVICLPGWGWARGHGSVAPGEEPPQAVSAASLADMNSQLKKSTITSVTENELEFHGFGLEQIFDALNYMPPMKRKCLESLGLGLEPIDAVIYFPPRAGKLEYLGLGLELASLGLEIYGEIARKLEFEEINNRLDQIDKKLGVIDAKLDQIQKLLTEGLDALSRQLDVSFTDLKSFIANKDINDRISKIDTYAFTTDPSGLYWICAKDRITTQCKDKTITECKDMIGGYITRWQAAVGVSGTYNIATMLGDIHTYIIPYVTPKDNQVAPGALDTYVDYLIAALNQAASKGTMNYDALKAAYLSYERFYSTILYWEHVGATLHTELYNSQGDQTAARGYLEGTFKQHIAAQNQRFLENGLRLVAAFSSYVPKSPVGTSCYTKSVILRDQQQLLARLGFFVASYNDYEAWGDKGEVFLIQRIVFARQDLLQNTSPNFRIWDGEVYHLWGPIPPCATVPMDGGIFTVFHIPPLDRSLFSYREESDKSKVLALDTWDFREMYCSPWLNTSFDEILPESVGSYNWNYTTDPMDPNHVFLNRNFIIIDN